MEIKPHTRIFENYRDRLQGIAYRMLGTVSDAEDVVQDAFLRFSKSDLRHVDNPSGLLTTIVSRLSIDKLRRLKVQRLNYPGPWLPEPLVTEQDDSIAASDIYDSLSTAFLLMLEKLSPLERAVFILREAFDYSHQEVAAVLGIRIANSRQLARRARMRFQQLEVTTAAEIDRARTLMDEFLSAAQAGDMDSLQALLCEDVIAYSDAGGRASAAIIPLEGIARVLQVFVHLFKKTQDVFSYRWLRINREWGLVAYEADVVASVTTVQIKHDKLHRIFVMRNPEKLKRIH